MLRRVWLFAVVVFGETLRRDEAVSDVERAEADASAVLSAVLRTLESAAAAERTLDDHFGQWCDSARLQSTGLADEIRRQVAEAETSNEQLSADEDRLTSERGLTQAALKDEEQQSTAAGDSKAELGTDTEKEVGLLKKASELAKHALRLVRNREAQQPKLSDLTEEEADVASKGMPLSDLLTAMLTEVDQQHTAALEEQDNVQALFSNVTTQATAAAQGLQFTEETVGTEGQERSRAAARFASVLSDLRRLVTAVTAATNATDAVCNSERDLVHSREGVADAEMDAVHTVLEKVSPDTDMPAFTQLFLSRSTTRESSGVRKQLHEFVVKMAQGEVASQSFVDAAAELKPDKSALVASKTVTKAATTTSAAQALQEIADFSAPDQESANDTKVAEKAYRNLVVGLKKEIAEISRSDARCKALSQNATTSVQMRAHEALFAAAQLQALNTTTTDLGKDAGYLNGQLTSLRAVEADFKSLVALEDAEFKKLGEDLKSFSQQLLTVATELTGASEKKIGSDVESLVSQLQAHMASVDRRHTQYAAYGAAVEQGTQTLARVLTVDLAHARHKLQSYATDTTYLAGMARAKERDQVLAKDQQLEVKTQCPPEQEAVRSTRAAALAEQMREVSTFWTSLRL